MSAEMPHLHYLTSPIDYILEGKITTPSIGMIYGDPGTKKTYSLIHLAVCLAMNKSWLGYAVKGCKVLIIDEESGELRLGRRLGMAIRGESGDENHTGEFVSLANFKLDKKDDLPRIQLLSRNRSRDCDHRRAERSYGRRREQQAGHAAGFNALRQLSELRRDDRYYSPQQQGRRIPGQSAIKGALDFMFKVESEDDSDFNHLQVRESQGWEIIELYGPGPLVRSGILAYARRDHGAAQRR